MPVCSACKANVPVGRFCSNCSAALQDVPCARCNTVVAAGSRYCHNCGAGVTSAGFAAAITPMSRAPSSRIPWIIGGTATAALVVLIIAQQLRTNASTENASLSQSTEAAPAGMRAPDISQMTPRERASRLFDRIMRLNEEGKRDSVALFSTMAIPAFQSLEPLDAHLRYDLGRIGAVAGMLDLAEAQADTILEAQPQHLLGLILAAQVEQKRGNNAEVRRLNNRLIAAESSERGKNLEEYTLHDADIRAAITAAQQSR